jgi:MFS superfamily sulfate permease-like transporter
LLLSLPDNLARALVFPDFSQLLTLPSLRWAIALAVVASVESLLTVAAVDRMDPERRESNLDRDLLGKGVCNMVLGSIGGLPIIAEIVRSSANVSNGAKTQWSNFVHGALIFLFLAAVPEWLHEIPLAALAAVLISVGWRLAHPRQFLLVAKIGKDHLLAFVTTLALTLAFDLLVGVLAGLLVEIAFNMTRGASPLAMFRLQVDESGDQRRKRLTIRSPLVFTNFLSLHQRLKEVGEVRELTIDLSQAPIVDHTVLEHLYHFQHSAEQSGRVVTLSFSDEHQPLSAHPLAARQRRIGGARR